MDHPHLSTADFRVLFESVPGQYLVLSPDLHIIAVSDAYLRATMTRREQILERDIFVVFPDNPDDPSATGERNLRSSLERVLRTQQPDAMPVQKYDIRRPESEGGGFEERYWSPVNSPVLAPDGSVNYIIHRAEDVTEFMQLKQAGRERDQAAAELQTRAEQIESQFYLHTQEVAEANRQLREANDHLAHLYQDIAELMSRADSELAGTDPGAASPSMTPEEMLSRVGQLITAHRHLEEQLRQSQKMEALGQLAGGVAHDFNNLLTIITGQAVLLQQGPQDKTNLSRLVEIEQAAHRAAALTAQLLAFSRKQIIEPRIVDVNAVVTGVEEMIGRLIGENIRLIAVAGSGLPPVKADPTQLELVIMNLAVNARDAMPQGGRLTMETSTVTVTEGQIAGLRPGEYVVISVTDTGHGMDASTAARIFEPFFTTKPKGKGTGLGLSSAHGIAQQTGGTLTVESAPGRGASFRLYLPAASRTAVQVGATRSPQDQPTASSGTGTILLVEDLPTLRNLVAGILRDEGYGVVTAANGEEALNQSEAGIVDLVLTDVIMPGITGPEMVKQLRLRTPHLKVVFMSGYDQNLLSDRDDNTHYLQKPFKPMALLAKVAQALAEPARGSDVHMAS